MTGLKKAALSVCLLGVLLSLGFYVKAKREDSRFLSYTVNPQKSNVVFYWKNEKGENFGNAAALKLWLKKQKKVLVFATNGGMYKKDHSPQGLYIENTVKKNPVDTTTADGNFYLKPNGVFYLDTHNKAYIATTTAFVDNKIKYATQSGPMLVIDGKIHLAFSAHSTNLNIRNGVGILPDHSVVFAMSKEPVNFYDFAAYFKNLGCKNALYLDGLVSRTYLPGKNWQQQDGDFGVIIAVIK